MSIVDPREQYSKKELYHQCVLEKKLSNGTKTTTTFLPKKYSQVGKVIKLKSNDGTWEDGWVVQQVSKDNFNSDYINVASREYLKHRKRTDI